MPNSDDLEMLGSLKDSTIARLLVSGKLPLDGREDAPINLSTVEGATESFSPQSLKIEQHELERVCQELAREMACLTHAQRKLRGGAIMRCRYCPFGASDARTMYSHYRFHEQVLSSQSAASRSHIEWMVAYRQQKWRVETPTDISAWGSPLQQSDSGRPTGFRDQSHSPRNQPSASNCLRSIVQSIRQNTPGRAAEAGLTPSPRAVAAASPLDAGSCGSSPLLSPAPSPCNRQRDGVVIKVEPDDVTGDARPGSCETVSVSMSPGPPEITGRDDAWSVSRSDGCRPHPHRVICRPMPRVMGNATPMLRAMLGKRRRTASLSSDMSAGLIDGSDLCKSSLATTRDTASQCDGLTARPRQEDATVQCELIASGCARLDDEPGERYSGEQYSGGRLRCLHCGIAFDDEVLHSLHMGCHSHRDPFICNVCGRQCNDRYGFYTHIMRGHQSP